VYDIPESGGLDEAPDAYATFDTGASEKFIIDPHGMIPA
jgi:glutathione-independent formaldehyde dehydrogenase